MALGILLAGHCLLRTAELVNLTWSQFDWSADRRSAVISLGITKGGARRGAAEAVTIDLPWLSTAMRALFEARDSQVTVVGVASPKFRDLYNQGIYAVGGKDWGFLPYSLRRGGATELWRKTAALSKVTLRGRWSQATTTRVYVNDGLAALAEMKLPPEPANALAQMFAKRLNIKVELF